MDIVNKEKIVIVGGNGAMGALFKSLWHELGYEVSILGPDDWERSSTILANVSLVVVSVPIDKTRDVIIQLAKIIPANAILADFTSIKVLPHHTMLTHHTGPVLALHPMFGPNITTYQKQVIINCGGRFLAKSNWVINSFQSLGFKLVNMMPAQHDNIMGFVQGIEHFNTFILGTFLRKHGLHPQDVFAISSPIYQAKLALMGRIFDQDANLYADIIMSDEARIKLIDEYIQYMEKWRLSLMQMNKEEFIHEFNTTSSWMGDFTHQSQLASDQFLREVNRLYGEPDAAIKSGLNDD